MGPTTVVTWVLFATMTTLHCTGDVCRPTSPSQALPGPHRLSVFPTRETCLAMGGTLEQQMGITVGSRTRSDVTIRKVFTYTCEPGG
jgi:hypothetical protein